ncbi:methylthioribose kinase-like isoform X2 [Haliotis asinina]
MNNVFRVDTDDNNNVCSNSVIIKHAGPYFKALRDLELHEDRGHVEFKALLKFQNLSPGCVPQPVFYDSLLRVLCIQDLRDYAAYLGSLINGRLDDDAALKLARDVAIIHRDTHVAKIGEDAIKQLDKEFQNLEMMDVIQRIHYTQPFVRNDPRNKWSETVKDKLDCVYGDQQVLHAVSRMKNIYLNKKEALIHGDLHNNSIMVKDKDIKMIDCECAFVGPCSFDVGFLVRNYILVYYSHSFSTEDDPRHRVFADRIIRICRRTVAEYFKYMTSVTGDKETFQSDFMAEVAGFVGCEIVRKVVGESTMPELQNVPHAEVFVLEAGVRLLKAHQQIHNIETLLDVALELAS